MHNFEFEDYRVYPPNPVNVDYKKKIENFNLKL